MMLDPVVDPGRIMHVDAKSPHGIASNGYCFVCGTAGIAYYLDGKGKKFWMCADHVGIDSPCAPEGFTPHTGGGWRQ